MESCTGLVLVSFAGYLTRIFDFNLVDNQLSFGALKYIGILTLISIVSQSV